MSEVITDKLTGKTSAGDVDVTSEGGAVTFQLQQGLAKAWCTADEHSSVTTRDSFNISSLTDNSAGNTSFVFTNSMNNSDFSGTGMAGDTGSTTSYDVIFQIDSSRATDTIRLAARNYNNGSTNDSNYKMTSIFGDLA